MKEVSLSAGGPSVTWEFGEGERARARNILHRLEDHRMLSAPYEFEEEAAVFTSAGRLRDYLNEQVEACETVQLRDQVRALRAALRQFLTDREASRRLAARIGGGERGQAHLDLLYTTQALGVLRGRAGVAVAAIARDFRIPLDGDLAYLMPPDLESSERGDVLTSMYAEDSEGVEYPEDGGMPDRPAPSSRPTRS